MTHSDEKILILGATGRQGGAVVRHLLDRGFSNVHALVRIADADDTKLLSESGITLEAGDLDDPASLDAAMKGVYGVFSVMPLDQHGPEAEIRRGRSVVDAAHRASVEHFVYSSVGGADRSQDVAHFRSKYVVEQHLGELGLPASIVRPALFMENFMTFERPSLDDGVAVFRVPLRPQTTRQMIAVEDIGLVVADVFARPGHFIGTTIEIAGDELTSPEVVAAYEKVTGKPARFEEQPIEEVRAFDPEFAAMFRWLNDEGFKADIATLRADYPQLATFETWLKQHSPAVTPELEAQR